MADLKSEIEGRNAVFQAMFKAGKFKEAAEVYAPDCKVMLAHRNPIEGRDNAEKMLEGMWKSGSPDLSLETDEVGPSGGDFAFERGHYRLICDDGTDKDAGKYVVVWKRVEGKLCMYLDILNSSLPA
ncbi:uncharacterized protein LOC117100495 [Anneissia japonica]|uniref:uncharacterized protein LOC117100495 n=1 Tax=Anneissia japonica TaxID=1529436 RepID=UPI001425AE1E|nr:uncharacterized protein LOC117100495 [Anneissia japonica]